MKTLGQERERAENSNFSKISIEFAFNLLKKGERLSFGRISERFVANFEISKEL